MARSHSRTLVAIWRDPDWVGLSARAQWLYLLLLSQPKLSLVGSLDVTVGKWSTLAQGVSKGAVEDALAELDAARFVVVDATTDELLIRTFTAHDLDPNRVNVNLARGLWGQWGCIGSAFLRSAAVHEMPAPVWDKLEPHAPSDAVHTRRSARLEPDKGSRLEPKAGSRLEPPLSSLLPPFSNHPPADPSPVEVDFEHHEPARIPEDLRAANLTEITALKALRHPLILVESDPAEGA